MLSTNIFLVRQGETELNKSGILQGKIFLLLNKITNNPPV